MEDPKRKKLLVELLDCLERLWMRSGGAFRQMDLSVPVSVVSDMSHELVETYKRLDASQAECTALEKERRVLSKALDESCKAIEAQRWRVGSMRLHDEPENNRENFIEAARVALAKE